MTSDRAGKISPHRSYETIINLHLEHKKRNSDPANSAATATDAATIALAAGATPSAAAASGFP